VFIYRDKVSCLSELTVYFIAASLSFFTTRGIRLLIERFELKTKTATLLKKLKTKTIDLVKKLRGGDGQMCYESSFEEFFDSDSISPIDLMLLPIQNERLSKQELFVKQIIKKCLKRDEVYRVTNMKLANLIRSMVQFQSKEKVRSISAELLALGMATSTPTIELMFNSLESLSYNFLPSLLLIKWSINSSYFSWGFSCFRYST